MRVCIYLRAYVNVLFPGRQLGVEAFMTNATGKRFRCGECGTEVIVTKAGEGTVLCCSKPMSPKE